MFSNSAPSYLNGFRLIESPHLTIPRVERVRRTWRERLFTRPWTPFRAIKLVTYQDPDPKLYRAGITIYGHPATLAKLKSDLFRAVFSQF